MARIMHHRRCLVIRRCPACGSYDVRHSHRRSLLEVLFLPFLLMRPFRCEDCGKRHYNLAWSHALPPDALGVPADADDREPAKTK
jgi:hypothetical protein